MAGSPLRRRFSTIRARTAAAACVVVALGLVVGAVLLVVVLERTLVSGMDDNLRDRADEVAGLFSRGPMPDTLAVHDSDDALLQVVNADRSVVASSANLTGQPPIAPFRPRVGRSRVRTVHGLSPEVNSSDAFRVVALTISARGGALTIYVGANLERVRESVAAVRGIVIVGLPLLLALVGATSWFVVGRALRPVDAIRREMADISAHDLGRRVPEPETDDEIGRLARTMNATLDRLQSFTDRQRRFVADASHELQSPLAASLADLEVALAHPDEADWPVTATELVEDNQRMTRLVKDLLYLARADDGAVVVTSTPVDLDDIVLAEVERVRAHAAVRLDATGVTPVEVRGNADQLARVVRNLLDNATRYARSEVSVELAGNGSTATLAVTDDGEGIPPPDRERIFERFTRLDDSRSRGTGGAGLGLAIAKDIVEGHRGTIALEPEVAGTRFVVELPTAG
jgi:signal transduction histidine kinase